MHRNRIKQRVAEGKLAVGTYVNLADPAVCEIIGPADVGRLMDSYQQQMREINANR